MSQPLEASLAWSYLSQKHIETPSAHSRNTKRESERESSPRASFLHRNVQSITSASKPSSPTCVADVGLPLSTRPNRHRLYASLVSPKPAAAAAAASVSIHIAALDTIVTCEQMASRQKAPTAASRAVLDSGWRRPSRYSYNNMYDAEVPAIMEPQSDCGESIARPSLLAFRSVRGMRMSQQQQPPLPPFAQHPQAPHALNYGGHKHHLLRAIGRKSNDDALHFSEWDDSSDTSSSDTRDSPASAKCSHRTSRVTFQRSSDLESDDGYDDAANETVLDQEKTLRQERAESVLAVMPMPFSGPIPLLERSSSDDDDNDIDTIICDPSRLPRMLVVDENGFSMSRESVMVRAANLPRGGVIKAGLLFKQGFGLRYGGWKVRYVVLTSSKMTFFREEQGRKRGEIDLAKCHAKSIEIMPRDSVFDGSQASMWRFAIRGKARRVLLSAYTEGELKEWLRCLHVALAVQAAGAGRYTDFVVPSGTFLAERGGGLMRSSGIS